MTMNKGFLFTLLVTSVTLTQTQLIDTSECGLTKGCLGLPQGCIASGDCIVIGTWTINDFTPTYTFEIWANYEGVTDTLHYIALGLSFDDKMGDDSVVACAVRPQPGTDYSLDMYLNNGPVIKGSSLYTDPKIGLSNPSYIVDGNELYCKYEREIEVVLDDLVFNLDQTQYHTMLATGIVNTDGEIKKHQQKTITAEGALLGEYTVN